MDRSHRRLTRCALFAALTALASQIAIPLEPVPINLALLPVLLSGVLLGPADGALSQLTYLLLGMAGAPVFSSLQGGLSALAGPTGGYLVGYLAAAAIAGLSIQCNYTPLSLLFGMVLGVLACYALGSVWFMVLTGRTLPETLAACVLPFLPGDALKVAVATGLARRLWVPLRLVATTDYSTGR